MHQEQVLLATESWTGAGQPIGVWATGGSLNTARRQLAGAGLQGAALAFGGVNPSARSGSY